MPRAVRGRVAARLPTELNPAGSPLRWPVVALLLVGTAAAIALRLGRDWVPGTFGAGFGPVRWAVVAAVAAIAAMPPVARLLARGYDRLAGPSPRTRWLVAILLAATAAIYLAATAHLQGRDLFPRIHDEQSYMIQMQMLARGRLWMPPHPLHDFFDTFYVLIEPKYASFYFAGTALLYVPMIWLDLPSWVLPAIASGACVGLVYRIVAESVDGAAGLLAAIGLLASGIFRVFSVMVTSHVPALLLELLAVWAWLRWRRSSGRARLAWAAAIGAFTGWAAIARPADAVCYAAIIGVGILLDLVRPPGASAGPVVQPPVGRAMKQLAVTTLLIVIGAAPFLGLQLLSHKGVTGRWMQSPYTYYLDRDQPNNAYGFQPWDPHARPVSRVQQKQDLYDTFYAPNVQRHQPDQIVGWWGRVYLPMTVDAALPSHVFLPLAFVGVLTVLADRRRLMLAALIPVFLVVFFFNTFYFKHYAMTVIPPLLLLTVAGFRQAAAAWPRWRPSILSGLAAAWTVACLLLLPEFNPLWTDRYQVGDEALYAPQLRVLKQEVPQASDLRRPAVILVTYRTGDNPMEEPVYNTDVAWPDEAPIIYAHDLGPSRSGEIFRYDAERQPDRFFYRWDRRHLQIEPLGYARDLAQPAAGRRR